MPLSAAALPIGPDDLARLRRWSSATRAPAVVVQRAKILLLAAEGVANTEIAERLGVSRPTVIAWRKRYAARGAHRRAGRPTPPRPPPDCPPRPAGRDPGYHAGPTARAAGRDPLVESAAGRRAGDQPQHRGPGVGRARPQALADRDVQVLHRPGAGGQGPRCGRAVPRPARPCNRAVCGREVPDPGAGTHPASPADGARTSRAAHPRLPPPRHDHPVRGAGGRHRAGDRRLPAAPSAQRVPGLPQLVARAYPRRQLHVVLDNYATHKHAAGAGLAGHPSRGSGCTSPRPMPPG